MNASDLKLRMVIVDDEPLARERARRLLEKIGGVEVVQEFGNAVKALAYIEADAPDVVLLDINMPELDGLRLMEALDDPPAVIFATAYEHHAVRAFELDAVDYILKPFSAERLGKALARVRRQLGIEPASTTAHAPDAPQAFGATEARIPADTGRGVELVPASQLAGAVIEESVVFLLRSDGERLCFARTLQDLERMLPEQVFLRASRSAIANLHAVQKYQTNEDGGLHLELSGNHELTVSRRRARFFREHLKHHP